MRNVRKQHDAHYKRENNHNNIKNEEYKANKENTKTNEDVFTTQNINDEKLQWHPAFFADIQIELDEEEKL